MTLVLCLVCILLMPLVILGLGLVHVGLGRSRSAAHAILATLTALSVAALAFVVLGFSFAGYSGGPAHAFVLANVRWDWLGAERLFAHGVSLDGSGSSAVLPLVLCLQVFAVAIAAVIPIGSGSDRWRLGALALSTALFSGLIWPVFAHWAWGGGWLAHIGATFGLASGFVDAGGSATIHATGGLTALALAWVLGARKGKYSHDGTATAIPGHNIVLAFTGCFVAFLGWLGLNSAGSLLFYGVGVGRVTGIVMNTTLSAAAAGLAALALTRFRFGKPDASLTANGWVGGLVASSAGCAFVSPGPAILIGLVAGILVVYSAEVLELKLFIDDPAGSISVHAVAGIWGTLAVGFFAETAPGLRGAQVLAQLVGIAALLGFVLPMAFAVNALINRIVPQRVDRDGDWQGMDIRELGAGAYPEFVVHSDEFVPR